MHKGSYVLHNGSSLPEAMEKMFVMVLVVHYKLFSY
jgi:hypothetical protein